MLGIQQVGGLVTDPDVKAAIGNFTLPAWATLALAIFGFVTIAARLRTVGKVTDENNQVIN